MDTEQRNKLQIDENASRGMQMLCFFIRCAVREIIKTNSCAFS